MRWVIGDIHGMVQPLATLLLAARAQDPEARFLFVGDYVNRGPDSKNVIELLLALQSEGAARFARGNHDDVFDVLVNCQSYAQDIAAADPLNAFSWFMRFGLGNTLKSYGVNAGELHALEQHPSMPRLRRVMEAVPADHRRFIRELEPVLEEPEFFVAHAMWDVAEAVDSDNLALRLEYDPSKRHRLIWGRYNSDEIGMPKPWHRPGFFGHTPVANYAVSGGRNLPLMGPSIVLLDTAAALSANGRLTAFCAETGTFIQADVAGRLLQPEPAVEVR